MGTRMRTRRGVTMMETVLGSLMVGGVLAATLGLIGPTARSTELAGDQLTAAYLAAELLAEIEAQPFEDPRTDSRVFGPEPDETGGTRSKFNDVDDYHNWSGPPQSAAGVETSGLTGSWLIQVQVINVVAGNPAVASATDTGVRRIVVAVSRDARELHRTDALRSRSFETAWEPDS